MTQDEENPVDVLRAHWSASALDQDELDEACGPQKTCKNMKDVSFDDFAEEGTDLAASWKATLRKEGKLSPTGASVRDLVLGDPTDR